LNVPTVPPPRGFESNGIWFRDEEGKMVEVAVKVKSITDGKIDFP
jgi:hypothetical protein